MPDFDLKSLQNPNMSGISQAAIFGEIVLAKYSAKRVSRNENKGFAQCYALYLSGISQAAIFGKIFLAKYFAKRVLQNEKRRFAHVCSLTTAK